jgi:hypothetical protein
MAEKSDVKQLTVAIELLRSNSWLGRTEVILGVAPLFPRRQQVPRLTAGASFALDPHLSVPCDA